MMMPYLVIRDGPAQGAHCVRGYSGFATTKAVHPFLRTAPVVESGTGSLFGAHAPDVHYGGVHLAFSQASLGDEYASTGGIKGHSAHGIAARIR